MASFTVPYKLYISDGPVSGGVLCRCGEWFHYSGDTSEEAMINYRALDREHNLVCRVRVRIWS